MDFWSFLAERFDLPILDWIADHLWCSVLDAVMPVITLLGDAGIFWIVLGLVLLCIPKTRKVGFGMAAALIMGLLLCNVTLKPLIARIRPYDYVAENMGVTIKLLVDAQHDFSFPSGHTIASFEAATVVMLHDRKWGIAALVLACLIAFSRLYLYVHYPTDVLASVVLGIGIGWLATRLVQLCYNRFPKKERAA